MSLTSFFERVNKEDLQRLNQFQLFFTKIPNMIKNLGLLELLYENLNTKQAEQVSSSKSQTVKYIESGILSKLYDFTRQTPGLFQSMLPNLGSTSDNQIDTIYGNIYGQTNKDLLDMATFFTQDGISLTVKGVQFPDTEIQYELDNTKRIRTIRPTGRNEQKLTITFYNFGINQEYLFFKKWIDLLNNKTNYYNFVDDIATDIIVYSNNRLGVPALVHQFNKCIPTRIQGLTYNTDTTEVQLFEVDFFVGEYNPALISISREQYDSMMSNKVG